MAKEKTNAELLEIGRKAVERQLKDAVRNKARTKAYQALAEKYPNDFQKAYDAALE